MKLEARNDRLDIYKLKNREANLKSGLRLQFSANFENDFCACSVAKHKMCLYMINISIESSFFVF